MQSRDLVGEASRVQSVYLQALRWALRAHQQLYEEYSVLYAGASIDSNPADNAAATVPARAVAIESALAGFKYSKQTHLEHIQYVLDASFELLTVDTDIVSVQNTLTSMAKLLTLIQDQFVVENSSSAGPMLYYQLKYFDFLG